MTMVSKSHRLIRIVQFPNGLNGSKWPLYMAVTSHFGTVLLEIEAFVQTKPGKQAVCSWSSSIVNMMSVLCFFGKEQEFGNFGFKKYEKFI